MRNTLLLFLFTVIGMHSKGQVLLEANSSSNAYTVINNVLAPGATAVETPDQTSGTVPGSHTAFGRHIKMVYDAELGKYVFQFLIHVNTVLDNDVSTGDADRQRVEMKTYAASPANLIGTPGETITYKWKFRLPVGFQPSTNFTHIHQVKAVGGDESNPIFTLTPRYTTTGNILQLIYVKDSTASNFYCATAPLSAFLGVWVEATEQLTVGEFGTYSMIIKRVSDSATLLTYSNNNIQTIRSGNSFIRPKWGIYRSISSASLLRDDTLRLASISITENQVLPLTVTNFTGQLRNNTTTLHWIITSEGHLQQYEIEYSNDGAKFTGIGTVSAQHKTCYAFEHNIFENKNYYRLKLVNKDGSFTYSNIITISQTSGAALNVFPNPANNFVVIDVEKLIVGQRIQILNSDGKMVVQMKVVNHSNRLTIKNLPTGLYQAQLTENDRVIRRTAFIIVR